MPSSKHWNYPECEAQVACEGNALRKDRVEKRTCAKCEKALADRGKTIPPRGEVRK